MAVRGARTNESDDDVSDSPVLVVASPDAASRTALERELRVRYGAEYTVLARSDYASAELLLSELARQQQPVALVIGTYSTDDTDGIAFLGRARGLQPTAKRAVCVTWGDFASAATVFSAMAAGQADLTLVRPEHVRDEEFHSAVSDALVDWHMAQGTGFEAVRIVGELADARPRRCGTSSAATTSRSASTPPTTTRTRPPPPRSPTSG